MTSSELYRHLSPETEPINIPEKAVWKNWSACPMSIYCDREECSLHTEGEWFEPKFLVVPIEGLGKVMRCLSYIPVKPDSDSIK